MKLHNRYASALILVLSLLAGQCQGQQKTKPKSVTGKTKTTAIKKKEVVKKEPSIITYSDNSISDSIRPILFHINDTTGEVTGCPYIRKLDKAPIMSQKADPEDKLLAKIKSQTQPRQMAESGQNEIVTGGIYNKLKTRLVCYSSFHGGALYEIRFYDEKGNLLNRHKIGGKYNVSETVAFNAAETFVTAILTNGDFWIFDANGRVVQQGNANSIIKCGDYCDWHLDLNKSGSIFLLSNLGETVLLKRDLSLIKKLSIGASSSYFGNDQKGIFLKNRSKLTILSSISYNAFYESDTINSSSWIFKNYFKIQSLTNLKLKFYYELL